MARDSGARYATPAYLRNRRLGWTSAGLLAGALGMVAAGAGLLETDGFDGVLTTRATELDLGSWLTVRLPGGAVLVAAALLGGALVLFAAAVEVARASRALDAKRRRSDARRAAGGSAWPAAADEPGAAGLTRAGEVLTDRHTGGDGRHALRFSVLIPAHDEAATIGAALASLRAQERPPERVVVVADNCTDDTADIARGLGAHVVVTRGNTGGRPVR